jgi:hypothetical protein
MGVGSGGSACESHEAVNVFRNTEFDYKDALSFSNFVQPLFGDWVVLNDDSLERRRLVNGRFTYSADSCFFGWSKDYAEVHGFTLDLWEVQRENLFHLLACLWSEYPSLLAQWESKDYSTPPTGDLTHHQERYPKARRSVVCEKSFKTRTVTPLAWATGGLSRFFNSLLLKVIGTDSRLKPETDPTDNCQWAWRDDEFMRSSDLTEATDLIPMELIQAMISGLVEGFNLPPVTEMILRRLSGPFLIKERGSSENEWFITTCGILMGCGTSWPLLSLYNLGCWAHGVASSGLSKYRRRLALSKVKIVGDDLAGLGPKCVSDGYTRAILLTGGSISEGKDVLSPVAGNLAECLMVKVPRLVYKDASSGVLALPTLSVSSLQARPRAKRDVTQPKMFHGPALSDGPFIRQALFRCHHTVYTGTWTGLRRVGLNPFVPRLFGGPGFPAPHSVVLDALTTLRPQWVRALRCIIAQPRDVSLVWFRKLMSVWTSKGTTCDKVSEELFADVFLPMFKESGMVEREKEFPSDPNHDWVNYSDWSEQVVASLRGGVQLGLPYDQRDVKYPRLGDVQKRLNRIIESANGLVPYPRLTDHSRNIRKGVLRSFQGLLNKGWPRKSLPAGNNFSVGCVGVGGF